MDLTQELIELFDRMDIAYNSTIVEKLGTRVEHMIDNGDLANPDPDFADAYEI